MGCFPVFAYFAEIVDFCAIQALFSGPFRKSAQKCNVKFSLCLVGRFEKAHKNLVFAKKNVKTEKQAILHSTIET